MDNEQQEFKDGNILLQDLIRAKENIKNGDDDIALKILDECVRKLEGRQPEMEQDDNIDREQEFEGTIKEAYNRG